jgi:VWFA-related protein
MAILLTSRRAWTLLSIFVLSAAVSPMVAGDRPALTYRSNPTEVRLIFSASDRENHGVTTLQANDFAVVDKDVIVRNFQSFTRSEHTRLKIAILLDASQSVAPQFRQQIDDILELLSHAAAVPDENVAVFSFQGLQPALVCARDCRTAHAVDRLPALRPSGLTPLFDTVVFASDYLSQHGDAQSENVLIIFSDGEDTISRDSFDSARTAAMKSEVQIFCIDLNQPAVSAQGSSVLYHLAKATGGRYFPEHDITTALKVILEDFESTYVVSYRLPSHASGFHTVQILPTHNRSLQFRSRSGYYYPDNVR